MSDNQQTQIEIRRPWRAGETVFLLGPGGVGKSSLGRELSKRLGWVSIDLDQEFCDRIGEVGEFIRTEGYDRYRAENLRLALDLAKAVEGPAVFIASSGFLVAEPGSSDYRQARELVRTGYGITLLPSLDMDVATAIVVERQLKRGFGLQREVETTKFRKRFELYRGEGDMLVVSVQTPMEIAACVEQALTPLLHRQG